MYYNHICVRCNKEYKSRLVEPKEVFCSTLCRNRYKQETAIERFRAAPLNKDNPNGCWEWQGSNIGGYGFVYIEGKRTLTHRLSYMLDVGEIPEGMVIMHTCDNPPCINPNHLRLGTRGDNTRDMFIKGRASSKYGALPYYQPLAEEFRKLYKEGLRQSDIRKLYGISKSQLSKILALTH